MIRSAVAAAVLLAVCINVDAQDQDTAARKFIADAQKWLKAGGEALIDTKKDVALLSVTDVVSASAVRKEMQGKSLFSDRAVERALYRIVSDASVDSVRIVSANMKAMEQPPEKAALKLCEEERKYSYCRAMQTTGWQKKDGTREFLGTFPGSGKNKIDGQALLVTGESGTIGQIFATDGTYTVRSITPDTLTITSSKPGASDRDPDDVNMPPRKPTSPLDDSGGGSGNDLGADARNCPINQQATQLDVAVGITAEARQKIKESGLGLPELLRYAEKFSNVSLANSAINGSLRVLKVVDVPYREAHDLAVDVNALLARNSDLAPLFQARTQLKADVTLLIVEQPDVNKCGRAAGFAVRSESAFAVVNWHCLGSEGSFVHEIGHLMGAWHDPKTLQQQGWQATPQYAQGYITTGARPIATLMSYTQSCPVACERKWFWANPEISYDGQALGTVDKNFDACVWRRRMLTVSRFDGK